MRRLELAVAAAGTADGAHVFVVFVELMNEIAAVAIAEEISAVGREADVRRAISGAVGILAARLVQFLAPLPPHQFALEVHLGEVEIRFARREIQELFAAFLANINAVPAAAAAAGVEITERLHELAARFKHEDRARRAVVRDVDEARFIDRHAVRRAAIACALREIFHAPIVNAFVLKFALADDDVLAARFVVGVDERRGECGTRGGGGSFENCATSGASHRRYSRCK